jgi:CRP-like cAMP-binding protein
MAKKLKEVVFDPMVFLATVDGGRTISKYRKNETIFRQGDPADAVFYIQKGKVKITVISEHGKEAVVALLGPDEFCGEGCLTGQPLRISTATAMTDCEIMRLEKAAIIRVLHEEPTFSEMFLSHLLTRTMRVEEDLVDQLFNSSEKRLARAIGELRQGKSPRAGHREGQPRDACGVDRYNALPRKFFYEQVPKIGLD